MSCFLNESIYFHKKKTKNGLILKAKNADYFKQYMTEDVERYISRKRQDNCHGNHIELTILNCI